jgi:hypothetical protein
MPDGALAFDCSARSPARVTQVECQNIFRPVAIIGSLQLGAKTAAQEAVIPANFAISNLQFLGGLSPARMSELNCP